MVLRLVRKEEELEEATPEVNVYACVILLAVSVTLMAVTAEFVSEPFALPNDSFA